MSDEWVRLCASSSCCRTRFYAGASHFWLLLNAQVTTRDSGADPWGICSSCAKTYQSAIPASFQTMYYFPPSPWSPSGSAPGATIRTSDWDRTSLCGIGVYDEQGTPINEYSGGADGDSLDPADWAALYLDLSDVAFEFSDANGNTRTPVGQSLENFVLYTSYLRLTQAWVQTFVFKGVTYRVTLAAGTVLTHNLRHTVSITTDDNDDPSDVSYYVRYSFGDNVPRFERVAE